ncbi:MAG: DUF262 domain-containing protein [Candidatus Pacebacteria bacterium]|nr:DUF262 domain-containing protein [Candidatus Paceibacterota bacterium]MDD4737720.1 DUF262 domain-containing protein [Candidatus Paceibacterota bacterium]
MSKISKLLEAIKDREIVVPEFQREYVWSLEQAKELLNSLFQEYPTGSVLVWETNNPPEIKNNAVDRDRIGWIKVLLDGQQRLTTLYLLIVGEIPPYYKEHDITHDPRHLFFNLKTAEFNYYQKQKMKGNPFWKSVISCFNDKFDAFTLVESLQLEDSNEKLEAGSIVNKNLVRLRAILDIDYFVQSVPQGLDIDKAIDIFDRVNSMGTKLTDAELVLTHVAGRWPQARRVMKQKIEDYEKVGFFFELDLLTRCLVVILTNSALYEKMTEEIYQKTTEDDYKETWKKLVKILDYIIPILKQSAYISGSRDMNTNNVFVPLVAYLSKNGGSFDTGLKNQFLYWMFLALIWSRYSGQTDQRLEKDVYLAINSPQPVSDLIKEIEDLRGRIEVKPADLEGRGSVHPLHRMLYIIAKHNKATDWANGGSLQDTMGDYYSIQSHHVFPQAFLYKNGYDSENHLDKKKVNEIANRAFITRDANFNISDKEPADYFEEIIAKHPEALKQQMIPTEKSLWGVNKYNEFLTTRRKMIADSVNSFLNDLKGKKVEEVISYEEDIKGGENDYVEFKSSLRWDYEQGIVSKLMESIIAKTIAAFMNSVGGKLLIGINDDGEILGIEKDYETLKNKNKDGFLLQLTQVINTYLGKEFNQYANIKIVKIAEKDICVVSVTSSAMPVFLKNNEKEEFYIRASASSQPMSIREANEYIKTHWEN